MQKLTKLKNLAVIMCLAMLLTGCGNKLDTKGGYSTEQAAGTKIMNVGEETVCLDEVLVYILFEIYQKGYTNDNIDANMNNCREAVLDTIRSNHIIYGTATSEGYSLSDSDNAKIEEYTKNFVSTFEKVLDKYGIREDVVKKVYQTQTIIEKFENDKYQELSANADNLVQDKYKDTKFFILYMYQVPTIQIDENSQPLLDSDGNYTYISDDEKKLQKTKCEEVREAVIEEVKAGKTDADSLEKIAENYGIKSFSGQSMGYVGMYIDKYNESFDKMNVGDVTEVDELDKGYVFYCMLETNSETARSNYISALKDKEITDRYSEMKDSWMAGVSIDNEKDMIGTGFADIDVKQMVKDMADAGIVSPNK